MNDNVLLLGRSGQVGTALARHLDSVIAPSRQEFDLTEATHDTVQALIEGARPTAVINCAAYTAVDDAEDEPEVADLVNGKIVGILAEISADFEIPFVTYSTDYVFDGQGTKPYLESSATSPINAYGKSKLIGERLALEANPKTLIIRTSWVISGTHPNFVATMLRQTGTGRPVSVVNDQQGSPTIADDLAVATLEALGLAANGILHVTNQEAATWFELARAAVMDAAFDPELVSPCTSAEYPASARRPVYSVLGSERLAEIGIHPLPRWQDSLPVLVGQLLAP